MNLLALAVGSFMIALSGALVPGPLFAITVNESVRRGAHIGPLLILGHALVELVIIALILAGLAPFLRHDTTRSVISLLGGLMLILMGGLMLRDLRKATLDLSGEPGKGRGMNLVLTGMLGSLANPYWLIWWATIGVGYLLSAMKYGRTGIIFFFAGHISADFAWYTLISFAAARGRNLISDGVYRGLVGVCAIFLICFGLWFLRSV